MTGLYLKSDRNLAEVTWIVCGLCGCFVTSFGSLVISCRV